MPNDPHNLADAPARTGRRRRPMRRSRSLGVQAAGVTDHLRDNGYGAATSGAPIPAFSAGTLTRAEDPTLRAGEHPPLPGTTFAFLRHRLLPQPHGFEGSASTYRRGRGCQLMRLSQLTSFTGSFRCRPPRALVIVRRKSKPVPMVRTNAISRPSGDQAGEKASRVWVRRFGRW
jgi:hypothetical protein